ncbi:hypothetical protein D3P08_00830 [Paenibacillus nanensis]|uniref:Uncharacterized protein n=1 Tax=Paenibacillus nanensis TaxID=393251 RepID=A0A3A1VRM3_9BACL|nr:hypothetical protein [Paenibacillus nanensis]RIX60160.1 hypothetical protein D3P08_00830 [Paenibacillus nanensis]
MKVYLILTQVLFGLSLIPWVVIWGLSFMSFDAGFSAANLAFVGTITLYPIAVIVCSVVAWLIHKRRRRAAIIVNLIPMVWVLAFAGLMVFV